MTARAFGGTTVPTKQRLRAKHCEGAQQEFTLREADTATIFASWMRKPRTQLPKISKGRS